MKNLIVSHLITASNLQPDTCIVEICDHISCHTCTGGREGQNLKGHEEWNYVGCEHFGTRVTVTVLGNEVTPNATASICEIELIGRKS